MKNLQKHATKIFVYASTVFGVLGVLVALTLPGDDGGNSDFNMIIFRFLMATGFVVLSSFALSVAGKYLDGKS